MTRVEKNPHIRTPPISGKVDEGKHSGLRGNTRSLQEAKHQHHNGLDEYYDEVEDEKLERRKTIFDLLSRRQNNKYEEG